MDFKNGTATFVMPHWRDENDITKKYLDETLETIFNQTDSNWQLVIVDDLSPCKEAVDYLDEVQAKHSDKIHIIKKTTNDGPGHCRNIGIRWAYENNSPFVAFLDADDLSDPKRIEVARKIFVENADASVVYSTFKVIDENSNIVPDDKLSPSIIEITDGHKHNPPQGPNAWIEIGTTKGYTNLTSATVVKTELAYKYPFPPEKVSEDSHAWMRYSSGGNSFVYTPEVPTLYRIPQNTAGSSSRSREGGKSGFYRAKARVDIDGFSRAVEIALTNGKIKVEQRDELMVKFLLKLADTIQQEQEIEIMKEILAQSYRVNTEMTDQVIQERGYSSWAKL